MSFAARPRIISGASVRGVSPISTTYGPLARRYVFLNTRALGVRTNTTLANIKLDRGLKASDYTKGFEINRIHSFSTTSINLAAQSSRRGQTLIEKLAQRYMAGTSDANPKNVYQGDFIGIKPACVMTHDNTGAVISKFESIGATKFADPSRVVFALDHDIQNKSEKNLQKYAKIKAFASKYGASFYPAGRGIGHQVMVEEGHAFPGTLTVASDSHSNMYGGIGALGTPVVRTDAASLWATGQTWWQVPPTAKVELTGQLKPGVTGKDIIVALCGIFSKDEVLNHAIEFVGDAIPSLCIEDRLAIANMTTEWGALAGVFPIDETLIKWYENRAKWLETTRGKDPHPRINSERIKKLSSDVQHGSLASDSNAVYAKTLTLDLSTLDPHVSGPDTVKKATPLSVMEASKIKVQKAYLVSCVNSRFKDIEEAANVIRSIEEARKSVGNAVPVTVAEGVEWYIAAASTQVQAAAEEAGHWELLLKAGAKPLPPGCGPCIGLGTGLLKDGEVGISATNRNYKGRMGSKNAQSYLSSPAVVAASALNGFICSPDTAISQLGLGKAIETGGQTVTTATPKHTIKVSDASDFAKSDSSESPSTGTIVDGFPSTTSGRLLYLPADNLNTDGIYPGKYTYQDDLTPETMAKVVMENYDPKFAQIVQTNDIVVSGANFGTGSSREQAATALLAAGVRLLLCQSASETFKRNAVNNGLLVLEAPHLVSWLKDAKDSNTEAWSKSSPLTLVTGLDADVSLVSGSLKIKDNSGAIVYEGQVPSVGEAAQEIIVAGGLEGWIKRKMEVDSQK
ncbi:mitochondrial Homoaconitase [Mycoemilia scoparia]|uniref:Homoaconitase, mitochondrial n=1 Tax=Mycoemilia scoparia TaxID=417184 RepID=A0A9W8A4P1_9FUNG|nr:mitochondrial Homoaconitase [Mycoemilia scoparia]